MNQELFDKSVETHMNSNWSLTAITFDNVPFNPPVGEPWVRMINLIGESNKTDLINRYRTVGILEFQLFVPLLVGVRKGKNLADSICQIWRSVTVNKIVFKTPSVQRTGEHQGWFQFNVSVPYYWDESF